MGEVLTVSSIRLSYNKDAKTKVTPFQLMYGRDPLGNSQTEVPTRHDPTSYERFLRKKWLP